ncbi:MAG: hypothetical protein HYU67_06945 [Flavobacteriia bacterium]|nr:hypothetical protein [Flavobacteriia bacterium]
MKNAPLIIFFLFFSTQFNAQTVETMELAHKKYSSDSLNKLYFNRVLTDEIIEAFETSTDFFIREWRGFTKEYMAFLQNNHFNFGKKTVMQIEVFFNKNEKIDCFFYQINNSTLTETQNKKLKELTIEFSKAYIFTLDASKPFSNYGTITFIQ